MQLKNRVPQWLKLALSDSTWGHHRDRRHRGYRARIESLETRTLLSTFNVTSLADAGAGSLRDAVSQANANAGADLITFASPGTITLTTGEIAITDSVTINGTGITVSGNSASRILNIGGTGAKTVTLNSMTLTSGNAGTGFGGAIYYFDAFESNDVLNVNSVTLTNNTSALGGAIFAVENTLNVTGSTFTNNTASGTGGTRGGGAIATQSSVATIKNSTL